MTAVEPRDTNNRQRKKEMLDVMVFKRWCHRFLSPGEGNPSTTNLEKGKKITTLRLSFFWCQCPTDHKGLSRNMQVYVCILQTVKR